MTEQEINDLILIADGYTLELTKQLSTEMKKGCLNCGDSAKVMQITVLKSQLEYKISIGDYGTETQSIYNCLLDAVASYSGASISVDPNASIPNTIIDVTIIGDNRPSWFDFSWDEMESSDEVDGARYTYINPILNGWNPSLQTGTTLLYLGVEYDMYDGGIIRLRDGFGIYVGSSIRADNFQPYTAPPLPPTGTQFIWNRTNLKSDNSPSIGSRSITVTTDLGSTTYGAFSFTEVTPQTVNIQQNGTDNLTLISGATTIALAGGNADNFVDTTVLGEQINVFNNNEAPIEGLWNDEQAWDDNDNWIDN